MLNFKLITTWFNFLGCSVNATPNEHCFATNHWTSYRTNLMESLRMLTRLFSVFVGSLPWGAGYGNCTTDHMHIQCFWTNWKYMYIINLDRVKNRHTNTYCAGLMAILITLSANFLKYYWIYYTFNDRHICRESDIAYSAFNVMNTKPH